MPDLTLIARAVDTIEGHLRSAISVADMAGTVSFSLYHFCRIFNQATHHTPYDYLMRRRLSEAARALLQTEDRILDIALDYQFNSHETFSRAFKRVFGLQPSQWRKEGRPDPWRLMPRLTLAHLEHLHKGDYLKAVVRDREAFQLAGLMTLVQPGPDAAGAVAGLWSLAADELARLEARPAGSRHYGLACYQEGWEERGFLYLAGAEVEMPGGAGRPSGAGQPTTEPGAGPAEAHAAESVRATALAVKAVPALTCACFVHKGRRRDLPLTLDYVFHTWLPKSGRALALPWVIEGYGPELPATDDDEAEMVIYIPLE
jgi:AraC family transcriptional regulator